MLASYFPNGKLNMSPDPLSGSGIAWQTPYLPDMVRSIEWSIEQNIEWNIGRRREYRIEYTQFR